MAGSRQSGAFHRRAHETREARIRQLTTAGILGVLGLVAVIVAAGLIWSVWLPPRQHVVTVGNRAITAGDLLDHAVFLYRSGEGRVLSDPTVAIDDLVQKEVLLQAVAPELDPVTDADIRALITERLGMPEETTDQEYAARLADYLRSTGVSRAELEQAVRTLVLDERLRERLRAEIPEAGEQLHLLRVATNDRARAEAVRSRVNDREPLDEVAVAEGIYTDTAQAGIGWWAPETLPERLRESLSALSAGGVSEVLDDANHVGFEVYQVIEHTSDLPYDESVRTQLANLHFDEYMKAKREALGVTQDLSDGERSWILDQLARAIRR